MNQTLYVHPEDTWIDRDGAGINKDMAVLRDEEGAELGRFPGSWTDEQVKIALNFANRIYRKGIEMGKWEKAREIRSALDIKEPS